MADGGEKNNERYMSRRRDRAVNYIGQDAPSSRNEMQASGGGDNNRDNRNINKEEDGVNVLILLVYRSTHINNVNNVKV